MPSVSIDWVAIVIATLVNMIVGMVWYSKRVFGNEWAKLTGRKMSEMGGGGVGYAVAGLGALLQAYILAHFVVYTGAGNFWQGVVTGFWLWLGFVAVVGAVHLVFEGRSWHLWKINTGYFLVVLLVNGGLLASWN